MSPILGIMASSISGSKAVTNSYESIATVTVGSGGSSSISFSSIPSTYKHLQIRATIFNSATGGINIQYNADTAANYTYHQLYGTGTSALANAGTAQNSGYIAYNNASGAYPTVAVVDILDYQNTNKYKTHRSLAGVDVNGSGGALTFFSGLWLNTAAISSLNIIGTFTQYSSFALYGVKG
jgi:hypothetical protein